MLFSKLSLELGQVAVDWKHLLFDAFSYKKLTSVYLPVCSVSIFLLIDSCIHLEQSLSDLLIICIAIKSLAALIAGLFGSVVLELLPLIKCNFSYFTYWDSV